MEIVEKSKKVRVSELEVPPPVLVTVYKINEQPPKVVHQYYSWNFYANADPSQEVVVDCCPGCGKRVAYVALHHCTGSKLPRPLIRGRLADERVSVPLAPVVPGLFASRVDLARRVDDPLRI